MHNASCVSQHASWLYVQHKMTAACALLSGKRAACQAACSTKQQPKWTDTLAPALTAPQRFHDCQEYKAMKCWESWNAWGTVKAGAWAGPMRLFKLGSAGCLTGSSFAWEQCACSSQLVPSRFDQFGLRYRAAHWLLCFACSCAGSCHTFCLLKHTLALSQANASYLSKH